MEDGLAREIEAAGWVAGSSVSRKGMERRGDIHDFVKVCKGGIKGRGCATARVGQGGSACAETSVCCGDGCVWYIGQLEAGLVASWGASGERGVCALYIVPFWVGRWCWAGRATVEHL